MLKRQYIVTVGWERCLVFYEDAKSDKRPVAPCRIVPDKRLGQQQAAIHQGHSSDILTAAMQANALLLPQHNTHPQAACSVLLAVDISTWYHLVLQYCGDIHMGMLVFTIYSLMLQTIIMRVIVPDVIAVCSSHNVLLVPSMATTSV